MMNKNNPYLRHLLIVSIAVLLALPFWYGRLDWDPEIRFWRAVGNSSFLLLIFTLSIGPLAKHWPTAGRLIPWRRETGIWFGLMASLHAFLVWHGWARWDIWRFLGYEFIPELDRLVRLEPGFGLANLVGMVALIFTLVLVATSSFQSGRLPWRICLEMVASQFLHRFLFGCITRRLLPFYPLHCFLPPPCA